MAAWTSCRQRWRSWSRSSSSKPASSRSLTSAWRAIAASSRSWPSAVRRAMTARRSVGSATRSTSPAASRPSTTPVVVRGATLQAVAMTLIWAPPSPCIRMIPRAFTWARERWSRSKTWSRRPLTVLSAAARAPRTSARGAAAPRRATRSRIAGEYRRPAASRSSRPSEERTAALVGGGSVVGLRMGILSPHVMRNLTMLQLRDISAGGLIRSARGRRVGGESGRAGGHECPAAASGE